jgi:hypothetical protein
LIFKKENNTKKCDFTVERESRLMHQNLWICVFLVFHVFSDPKTSRSMKNDNGIWSSRYYEWTKNVNYSILKHAESYILNSLHLRTIFRATHKNYLPCLLLCEKTRNIHRRFTLLPHRFPFSWSRDTAKKVSATIFVAWPSMTP